MKVTLKNNSSVVTKTVEYRYDSANRLMRRIVDGTTAAKYVHDGDELAMELNASDTLTHRYLWGAAVDQILADEQIGGELLWTLGDHQGTVRDLVDNSANLELHRQYDSFGNVTSETGAADHLFGFTGRMFDEDTGLQNNLNRWYDPAVGRWLSEDPLGHDAGDPNLYRYSGNSPLMNIDPGGLCWTGIASTGIEHYTGFNAFTGYGMTPSTTAAPTYTPSPANTYTTPTPGNPFGETPAQGIDAMTRLASEAQAHERAGINAEIDAGIARRAMYSPRTPPGGWASPAGAAIHSLVSSELAQMVPEAVLRTNPMVSGVVDGAKLAYHEAATAAQVATNARAAGYGPVGTAYLAGGVVAGDLSGVTNASYIYDNTHPATGQRAGNAETWARTALGSVQLGTIGYSGAKGVAALTGAPSAVSETLTHRNSVFEVLSEQPISGTSRSAHRAAANRGLLRQLEARKIRGQENPGTQY